MLNISLLDAIAVVFIAFRLLRANRRNLGNSLHSLISISLLGVLLLGFRIASQLRGALGRIADFMSTVPGLGSKVLIILLAWYLIHLLRKKIAYWLEAALPESSHKTVTFISELLRTLILIILIAWLTENWFSPNNDAPLIIQWVRLGDYWLLSQSLHQAQI